MNPSDRDLLRTLLTRERIAHLATLRQDRPLASMTLFLAEPGFGAFHVHVSRLAWHTQDMARDPRVALSVAERDDGREDPFTLARVSIRADARALPGEGPEFERLRAAWLARFPAQAINFELADFGFWRLEPLDARFVAGFGRIHNLSAQDLAAAAVAIAT